LVPRLYDPDEGAVLIDGVDARSYTLESLQAQVAVVPQESVLFRATLAENIAYGRPGATRAEIEAAARVANAHDFITALPHGYDTVVGERGETLSGGQRQRVAIARALVRNAPVLILDEPTSGLDVRAEREVLDAIERLVEGRTTIVIAHRLSTVRRADRIAVLVDGCVVECGTHAELMARGERYAEMVALTTGDRLGDGIGGGARHDDGNNRRLATGAIPPPREGAR
ncbi:MAG TPA: ATP-binding cassette domain-containing protein, partial [Acidimicrobiia bacterium]|nr:ATP-binding cassette domain-containing protein [Acidimicrobiia bacterium]